MMRCVRFCRVYEATIRINGARSVRGEVEWRWVRRVMEVGKFGLCDLLCTRYLGLGREEMKVQRGDKDSKKADQVGLAVCSILLRKCHWKHMFVV